MKQIAIYGASGCGRGVLPLARQRWAACVEPHQLVFVDDNPAAAECNGHPVLTYAQWLALPASSRHMSVAIANSAVREQLVARCEADGVDFFEVRAPNVVQLDDVRLGAGAILCPFVTLTLWAALPAIFQCPHKLVTRLSSRFFETGSSFDVPNDTAVLRSIGVLTSERGGGAAGRLLGAFEQMALRQGATHIYLTTDQDHNERAQNFYKRHGYGVEACFHQDGRRPMWLMSKHLMGVVHE